MGECKSMNMTLYVADEFGYITIDNDRKSVDIFKVTQSGTIPIKVASCTIKRTAESYLTISSLQPTSYKDLGINISKEHRQSPDSVIVTVKIPESEANGLYIRVEPSIGTEEKYRFSSEGFVEFHLKKYGFEFDNYFSLIISPEIHPFERASSWGDSETMSFLDLRMDEALDLSDRTVSRIDIYIPDFSKEIFRKWVILDDFVLIDGLDIIWRNKRFVRANED